MLTVLIPAHNEAGTIREVVEGAIVHANHVMVINDGSTDDTVAQLNDLPVQIIDHADNIGKGPRLWEGLAEAVQGGATSVLTMDADLQHDPADIPVFRQANKQSPNAMIIGDRLGDAASMPGFRAQSIGFGDFFVSWCIGRRFRDAQCGMRLYPASMIGFVEVPLAERAHFVFESAVLLHAAEAGIVFERVPIKARYKGFVQRPSHFRPLIDTWRIIRMISGFLIRRGLKPSALLRVLRGVR